jgi:hypothetical protein
LRDGDGAADVLETIWIGRSSGHIMQVSEVEGTLPAVDEVTVGAPVTDIAIGSGVIWVSVDRPAGVNRTGQLWAVNLEHVVASIRSLEA